VDEESSRLDELIGEAMEIAMIESHSIRTRPEPQHTAIFLEQALQQSHAELAARKVTIKVQEPDDPVWFDPHLIGRALRHLLENAARYTPEASHILLESRRSKTRLEFVVTDDGPGIDPHDLPLIFEKFYRGSRHEKQTRGTGMGLAIARALVTVHGGEITAASTPGRGASFCISIPRFDRSPEAEPEHTSQEAQVPADVITAKAATL
jgi:two-component system sensor histidine kinase KdpD